MARRQPAPNQYGHQTLQGRDQTGTAARTASARYTSGMRIATRILLASIVSLTACSTASTAAQGPRAQAPADVVATVGSTSVTLRDVDERALERPAADFGQIRLSQAVYDARRSALDTIVGNLRLEAEAKARGIDRATLVDREITSKVAPPTEADIAAWYQANPARVQGAPLDQVRTPIRALLIQERSIDIRRRFLDTLQAKTPVRLSLEPPREKVAEAGRPARGPSGAPVEIIEFSDFQCPFCLRAHPVVAQVLAAYGDRVRFVYRNYPLPSHPNARPAAEAAACAAEQGKFWEYHDRLFDHQDKLGDSDLKAHAVALGLESGAFNACVNTRKYQKDVDADIADANDIGVTGTPAFFINGRPLDGAQPLEVFKQIIDEELKGR
jgi:protein-disulfide isomerase